MPLQSGEEEVDGVRILRVQAWPPQGDYYIAPQIVPIICRGVMNHARTIERKGVDMFLPVSQAIAEASQLARYRLPYRVIPNFIPDDADQTYDDGNACVRLLPEGDFLLFVGDLVRDKGVEVLLQA
jgi:glycosyltransferase involved in cell wall biosynthesis